MYLILGIGIAIFAVFVTLGWWIGTYNFFKSTKQAIKTQWSNIVTEYERRVDLFLNLANTVKSIKKHERETLEKVTQYRAGIADMAKGKQMKAMGKVDAMIAGFIEAYPKLVTGQHHLELMEEIRITEDRINGARTGYNEVVREYNTELVTFPGNIVANHYRFEEEKYYETDRPDVTGKAPAISL